MGKSTREMIKDIPNLTKIAAAFFIIGKIHFIPAAGFALVDIVGLNKLVREEKKTPSAKDVERWAREYNII